MFLNVVLGHKQDLTDCAENLDKENPSTRSLLWLRLVLTFQKSAAKIRNVGQCFIVANATHGPHSPMNVPKQELVTSRQFSRNVTGTENNNAAIVGVNASRQKGESLFSVKWCCIA